MSRKRVYISSSRPVGFDEMNTSVMIAEEFCKHAIDLGMSPFSPLLFYPILYPLSEMMGTEKYITCSRSWLEASHVMWVIGPLSEEVRREIRFAERCHVPVQFYDESNIIYKKMKKEVLQYLEKTSYYLED